MHYYQFNISDYRKDTAHLTLIEHAIYRAMIDMYYLDEHELCGDNAKLMRSLCVRTEEEKEAFENVISDFFTKTENGYFHGKCNDELQKIYGKSEKARKSAEKRWSKDANAMRTHSECNANGMLPNNLTPNNLTPNKKKKDKKEIVFSLPENVTQETWDMFVEHRNHIKKPLTQNAGNLILKKLERFGALAEQAVESSIENGWAGVFEPKTKKVSSSMSAAEKAVRARAERLGVSPRDLGADYD